MEQKKLYRSRVDTKICGVCGGIAEYFNVDSTVVRLIAICAAFSGAGLIAYFAAAIIIPEKPE